MANLRTITNFKSALRGGGARPNLVEVDITGWPGGENMGDFGNDAKEEFQFLCKAAALPSSNITPIEIPFRGRTLKVAGDRTFDTWTITVINDENFRLRTKFEQWMNGLNDRADNTGVLTPRDYQTDIVVEHLDRNDQVLPGGLYTLRNAFPIQMSEIALNYAQNDIFEEFTVTWQYSHYDVG